MQKYKENKPTAEVLMNSMRAIGYSFESAVADVIDNSISAHASLIEVKFPLDPSLCYVAICDDGCGMNHKELFDAMKYGSELKGKKRAEDDLGRFGLGLKAASLSQCRRLTVVSKKDNEVSAYIWDLDIIEEKKGWYMIECKAKDIPNLLFSSFLNEKSSGTVVIWEYFDLIEKSTGNVYSELSKYADRTAEYLSLIFHRFLNKDAGENVSIKVNNYTLLGLDPFLENNKKTNIRRRIEIPIPDAEGVERIVIVQPFVLPFQKDLSIEDKRLSGGIENYRSKQGFYVYRNRRLIIWGTWFGRHRDELTKYARVRVDIPNTLDDIWGIDIKKQNAKIPLVIKNRLTKAVDDAMDIAMRVQTYRGRIAKTSEKIDFIWDRIQEREYSYSYRINRDSKIFDIIKSSVDDSTWNRIDMILDEIESNIPYQQIYIDKSQNRVYEEPDADRIADVEDKGRIMIDLAMDMGAIDRVTVIENLFKSEPFIKFPALKKKLLEERYEH